MKQSIDTSIDLLDGMRLIYGLSSAQLEALNQGINALMIIKDGNYKLDTSTTSPNKDEIVTMLRACANIIEKGV